MARLAGTKNYEKVIGFSKNREKLAREFKPGDKMLVYTTNPTKKIIAGIEVTKSCKECIQEDLRGTDDHELPVGIKLVFGPVPGITLEAAGINYKPTEGSTYVPINKDVYEKALSILKQAYA